ncbi:Bifunctional glutamine synthetase adenylyltransferase/adenylyl-removing enzyme [Streptomyces alboniger]
MPSRCCWTTCSIPRIDQLPFRRADIAAEISRVLGALDERDAETELERITEFRSSTAFRLGLAFNDGRVDAEATARRPAQRWPNRWWARCWRWPSAIWRHGTAGCRARGRVSPCSATAAWGGGGLGFASDLDLVFVFDGQRAQAMSDGERPLEGYRWYQRLAQRVMNWLTVLTRAGRLFEVDTRLRPDGSKGLLVSSLTRSWPTSRAAPLDLGASGTAARARPVAGDAALGAEPGGGPARHPRRAA